MGKVEKTAGGVNGGVAKGAGGVLPLDRLARVEPIASEPFRALEARGQGYIERRDCAAGLQSVKASCRPLHDGSPNPEDYSSSFSSLSTPHPHLTCLLTGLGIGLAVASILDRMLGIDVFSEL